MLHRPPFLIFQMLFPIISYFPSYSVIYIFFFVSLLIRYGAEEEMHFRFKVSGGPFCADRAKLGIHGGVEWFVFETTRLEEVKGEMQKMKKM